MSEISIDDLRLKAVQLAAQTNPSSTQELLSEADKILGWVVQPIKDDGALKRLAEKIRQDKTQKENIVDAIHRITRGLDILGSSGVQSIIVNANTFNVVKEILSCYGISEMGGEITGRMDGYNLKFIKGE